MDRLREANEHLIVANLRSQALAEEADRANHLKDEFIPWCRTSCARRSMRCSMGADAGREAVDRHACHACHPDHRTQRRVPGVIIDDLLDMSRIIAGTMN